MIWKTNKISQEFCSCKPLKKNSYCSVLASILIKNKQTILRDKNERKEKKKAISHKMIKKLCQTNHWQDLSTKR